MPIVATKSGVSAPALIIRKVRVGTARDRVYILGAQGKLFALNIADGKKIWEKDLSAEFGSEIPKWRFSTSPLIEGELLLVETGGVNGNMLVDMVIDRETKATAVAL
jgi:outer membrane protein assembly factor BamB